MPQLIMTNDLLNTLIKSVQMASKPKTSPYDSTAVVKRVEDGVAWVQIPGGVDETPVKLTVNAEAGDTVQVRVSGGTAFLVGNATAPPTDDRKANAAQKIAVTAQKTADGAVEDAERAKNAADDAERSAASAQTSANNANEYASRALSGLSTVQSVAETLTWITQHGTMTLTTDTALDPTHVYFVQDAQGDYVVGNVHYSVVAEPKAADLATYYVLSIDESLNNYVATHLAVTEEGLWVLPATTGYKVLIATGQGAQYTTAGTYIIDASGNTVATFGETVQIGLSEGNHVRLVGDAFSILYGDARQFSVEENRLRSFDEYGTEMFDIGAHSSSVGRVAISDVEDGIIYSDSASKTWSHTLHQVVSSLNAGSSFGLVCYLGYTRNGSSWTWDFGYDSYDAASTSKRRAHYNSQDFNFTKGTAQTKTRTYNTYYPDVVTVQAVYDGDKTVTFSATSVSNGIIAAAIQTERIVVNANMRRPSMSMGSSVYKPYSVALGEGLYANKNEVVLGKYNVDFYEALYALQIGGGTDFENPQDLFRVSVDGDIQFGIPDYATSGTEDYTLYNLLASIGWGSTSSTNPVILDDDGTVV